MSIKKAGCILIDVKNKKIGLVYRKKTNDFSFPKGHLEVGESLKECALRETMEETGRNCKIVLTQDPIILKYKDSLGNKVENYMYFAIDKGLCSKIFNEKDMETLIWKTLEDVENSLTYDNLKEFWKESKPIVMEIMKYEKY